MLEGHQAVSWLVMRAVPLFEPIRKKRDVGDTIKYAINRDNEKNCHSSDVETAISGILVKLSGRMQILIKIADGHHKTG